MLFLRANAGIALASIIMNWLNRIVIISHGNENRADIVSVMSFIFILLSSKTVDYNVLFLSKRIDLYQAL